MVQLSEIAELIMGQSPPSSTYNDSQVGLPFFQGKADFGFRFPTNRLYCTDPKKIAEPGDILISVRAPVGPTNLSNARSCIGRGLAAIRPRRVDGRFLYYALRYQEERIAALGTGSTFKSINKAQLAGVELDTEEASAQEQAVIGALLWALEDAIEQQDKLIALTAELKKALMHKLFTEGTRGEPQKETEIGLIPESWDVVPLGDLALIGNGSTPKRDNAEYWTNGSIPWLTSGKIHEGLIRQADEYVTELASSECHLPPVPANSLLVAITGQGKTLGNAAQVTFETRVSQHLACIRWRQPETICAAFFRYFLQRQYEDLRRLSVGAGSTKRALTCGTLKRYLVPLPDLDEQTEIAETLQLQDTKRDQHLAATSLLRDLFRTLLHQLMTAQVRVDQVDLSELKALGVEVD